MIRHISKQTTAFLLGALLVFGVLAILGGKPLNAETRLSIDEAKEYAAQMLKDNNPWAARAVALGILKGHPDDFSGLVIVAQSEMMLGRFDVAQETAKHAWRVAETDNQKFTAAYMVSQALMRAEKFTQAQLWLRRSA